VGHPIIQKTYDTIYSKHRVYRLLPIYLVGGCGAAWSKDEPLKGHLIKPSFRKPRSSIAAFVFVEKLSKENRSHDRQYVRKGN
jgi:hypothetical protein